MSKTIALSHVPLVLLNLGHNKDVSSYTEEDLALEFNTPLDETADHQNLDENFNDLQGEANFKPLRTLDRSISFKLTVSSKDN